MSVINGRRPSKTQVFLWFQIDQAQRIISDANPFRRLDGQVEMEAAHQSRVWRLECSAAPGESVEQDLAREWASGEQIMHRLGVLIAEKASRLMGQAIPLETLCSPTPILQGKPDEDLDAEGRPGLPGEHPVWGGRGPMEQGEIA